MTNRTLHIGIVLQRQHVSDVSLAGIIPLCGPSSTHLQKIFFLRSIDRVTHGKSISQLDSENILPAFAAFLSDHLREFLYTFKHHAFSEEGEWRVVFPFVRDDHIDSLKFRDSSGMPVPYLELDLGAHTPELPILPLVEVVHGPTLHPELTKKSLHLMLQQHGYDHVEVVGSEAPLRP